MSVEAPQNKIRKAIFKIIEYIRLECISFFQNFAFNFNLARYFYKLFPDKTISLVSLYLFYFYTEVGLFLRAHQAEVIQNSPNAVAVQIIDQIFHAQLCQVPNIVRFAHSEKLKSIVSRINFQFVSVCKSGRSNVSFLVIFFTLTVYCKILEKRHGSTAEILM